METSVEPPKKALGYVRVSTDKQGEYGLGSAAQVEAIRTACGQKGWTLVDIERDQASGASTNGRPGLKRARARMHDREADILVAAKLDRLSRSVVDFGNLLDEARKARWAVRVLDLDLDTSTAVGEMMSGILVQVAQFERRRISERTQQAMDQLPDGEHLNAKGELKQAPGRKRQISADLEALVWWLHEKHGQSVRQIAATLTEQGRRPPNGGKWQPSTIQRVLARSQREAA